MANSFPVVADVRRPMSRFIEVRACQETARPSFRQVLECGSPLPPSKRPTQSGRGLPHSKTLARCRSSLGSSLARSNDRRQLLWLSSPRLLLLPDGRSKDIPSVRLPCLRVERPELPPEIFLERMQRWVAGDDGAIEGPFGGMLHQFVPHRILEVVMARGREYATTALL